MSGPTSSSCSFRVGLFSKSRLTPVTKGTAESLWLRSGQQNGYGRERCGCIAILETISVLTRVSRFARRETFLQFHEVQELRIGRESKAGLARQAKHLGVGGKRFAGKTAEACARRGANEPVEQEFSKPQAMELV